MPSVQRQKRCHRRYMCASARPRTEYLISVCNRVQQNLEIEDGRLPATTKKESGHGMGLVNVQEILRKYGAEYTVSCRDCWFRFTCSLPVAHSTDNS